MTTKVGFSANAPEDQPQRTPPRRSRAARPGEETWVFGEDNRPTSQLPATPPTAPVLTPEQVGVPPSLPSAYVPLPTAPPGFTPSSVPPVTDTPLTHYEKWGTSLFGEEEGFAAPVITDSGGGRVELRHPEALAAPVTANADDVFLLEEPPSGPILSIARYRLEPSTIYTTPSDASRDVALAVEDGLHGLYRVLHTSGFSAGGFPALPSHNPHEYVAGTRDQVSDTALVFSRIDLHRLPSHVDELVLRASAHFDVLRLFKPGTEEQAIPALHELLEKQDDKGGAFWAGSNGILRRHTMHFGDLTLAQVTGVRDRFGSLPVQTYLHFSLHDRSEDQRMELRGVATQEYRVSPLPLFLTGLGGQSIAGTTVFDERRKD